MNLDEILKTEAQEIIENSLEALKRAQLKSYNKSKEQENKSRLLNLLALTELCVKNKNLLPMTEYSEKIAKERFNSGFDLYEVHTAFNVLEEELWKRVTKKAKPDNLAKALGLVSTVLGAGKETLALTYVSLAGKTKTKTLDLSELFSGR